MSRDSKQLHRRGVAAVETAVILPVLLLLVFGFIEIGYLVNSHQTLHDAARQGARAAVRLEYSNPEVENVVTRSLANSKSINSAAVTVRLSKLDENGNEEYQVQSLDHNEMGEAVRVTVTVDYAEFNPPSSYLGISGGTITNSAVMQRQK